MRSALALGFIGLLAIAGCDKGAGSGAPAGSAAPASGGGGGAKLTKDQLEEAYKVSDINNWDKSLSAVKGKLGAPAKSDAESAVWYGLKDGKTCYELKITKSKGNELGMVDMAGCK